MPKGYTNPVLDRDFPDPNVIRAADGWCYGYATQALGERPVVNIQVARSRDMVGWEYLGEALPQRPPWARTTQMLWAPHVIEHGGVYVMAYSAAPDDPPYPAPPDDPALCLGLAVSESPAGPFTDVGAPLRCGPTTSDIDPCVFRDPARGGWYCYWGSGGDIVVQELAPGLGSFAAGSRPWLLLRGWSAEPKLPFEHGIEGPFVVEREGWYHLWYSGDRTWTYPPNYATMVARRQGSGWPVRAACGRLEPVRPARQRPLARARPQLGGPRRRGRRLGRLSRDRQPLPLAVRGPGAPGHADRPHRVRRRLAGRRGRNAGGRRADGAVAPWVGHGRTVIEMLDGSVPPQTSSCRLATVSVANHGSASVPGCGTYSGKSLDATCSRRRCPGSSR